MNSGLTWPVRISTAFQRPLTVIPPLHQANIMQSPAIMAFKADCNSLPHGPSRVRIKPLWEGMQWENKQQCYPLGNKQQCYQMSFTMLVETCQIYNWKSHWWRENENEIHMSKISFPRVFQISMAAYDFMAISYKQKFMTAVWKHADGISYSTFKFEWIAAQHAQGRQQSPEHFS